MNKLKFLCFLLSASLVLGSPISALAATGESGSAAVETEAKLPVGGYVSLDTKQNIDVTERYTDITGKNISTLSMSMQGTSFPTYYSGVEEGYVPSVMKDQGDYNMCWAIAAATACQMSANVKGISCEDTLSSAHMGYYFYNKGSAVTDRKGNVGGDYARALTVSDFRQAGGNGQLAMWELASWVGIPSENGYHGIHSYDALSQDGYSLSNTSDDVYGTADIRVKGAYLTGVDAASRDNMKYLIQNYGAVTIGYYAAGDYDSMVQGYHISDGYNPLYGSYYCDALPVGGTANHAVTVIGWDDNYSRDNFVETPSGDGAWLILNSWGDDTSTVAQSGYFWLSYEDAGLLNEGVGIAYDVERADIYDNIYQYDGSYGVAGVDTKRCVQIFKISEEEKIPAFTMAVAQPDVSYTATLYQVDTSVTDIQLQTASWLDEALEQESGVTALTSVTGTVAYAGHHTVAFDSAPSLASGSRVILVVKFNTETSVYVDTTYVEGSYWSFVTGNDAYRGLAEVESGNLAIMPENSVLRLKLLAVEAPTSATGILLDKESLLMKEGESKMLQAAITPENATAPGAFVWASSDPDVASVSTTGAVTAHAVGTCQIRVTSGNLSATCMVTVDELGIYKGESGVTSFELVTGTAQQLTARFLLQKSEPAVTWESSNPAIVSVSDSGMVSGLTNGTANIIATTEDGVFSASCSITVAKEVTQDFTFSVINKDDLSSLQKGDTAQIKTQVSPSMEGITVFYQSSNEEVITVSENGILTAVNAGTVKITVSAEKEQQVRSDSFFVTVTESDTDDDENHENDDTEDGKEDDKGDDDSSQESLLPNINADRIVITNESEVKKLTVGDSRVIEVSVKDDTENAKIHYKGDGTYVSITEEGVLKALKAGNGNITITAQSENMLFRKTIYVTVVPKGASSLLPNRPSEDADVENVGPGNESYEPGDTSGDVNQAVTPAYDKTKVRKIKIKGTTHRISYKGKLQLTATVHPSTAVNKDVVWFSSNKKYATVTKTGLVKAKKAGKGKSVVITCKAKDGSKTIASYCVFITKDYVKKLSVSTKKTVKQKVRREDGTYLTKKVTKTYTGKITVKAGERFILTPAVKTTGKDVIKKYTYKSSNPKWANVSSKGKVTTKKAGKGHTVVITVSMQDQSVKKTFKVKIK